MMIKTESEDYLVDDNKLEVVDNDVDDASDEMFEHFSITIDKGQSMMRIDKFLTGRIEGATRNRIQNAAEAGTILVNGKSVKSSYKIKPFDNVSIVMPYPISEVGIVPEDIPINIVYEDDDILIINKEAGMVVHPGFGNFSGTLVNAVTWHLKDLPLFQSGDMRAGLVHRIDKNTSGIIVMAKNEKAHVFLAKQFYDHTIDRTYNALVWGNFAEDSGTIIGNIARHQKDRMKMGVYDPESGVGKHAITHYNVLKRFGYVNMIECKLETGRTHQIRVHMESVGHPLFNDERYGGNRVLKGTTFTKYKQFVENCFTILPRHALHAKSLGLIHPTTKEYMFFDSELPNDMSLVLEKWNTYSSNVQMVEE